MKLIITNGPRGSGKDTAFDYIKGLIEGNTTRNVIEFSFKDVLYGGVADRYNLNYETVKQMNEDHDVKLEKTSVFRGKSVVEALIYESEEIIKKDFGEDGVAMFAVRHLISKHHSIMQDSILLNRDGGFQNEIDYVVKALSIPRRDLFVLRLERDGCSFTGDSRSYLPKFDRVVANNGTIEDFHKTLKMIMLPYIVT